MQTALRRDGFVVLRGFFAAEALADEVARALAGAGRDDGRVARFRYVPMMDDDTPASLRLLERLEPVAAALLGGPVLPTRAKGTAYDGETPWHADNDGPPRSLGCLAYLEALTGETGALQARPGSHEGAARDAVAIETRPGDVIVMDERLAHASAGGGTRLQWRVDFVRDPRAEEDVASVRAYYARVYAPDWDGGYDPDRHPSYGAGWRRAHPAPCRRLAELGVLDLAAAQEANMRARRPA